MGSIPASSVSVSEAKMSPSSNDSLPGMMVESVHEHVVVQSANGLNEFCASVDIDLRALRLVSSGVLANKATVQVPNRALAAAARSCPVRRTCAAGQHVAPSDGSSSSAAAWSYMY